MAGYRFRSAINFPGITAVWILIIDLAEADMSWFRGDFYYALSLVFVLHAFEKAHVFQ